MRTEIDNLGLKMLSQRARIELADHANSRHFIKLPADHTREDLFVPSYWCNHDKIAEGDLLRVCAADGSFDIMITAAWVRPNGIIMKPWPIEPPVDVRVSRPDLESENPVVERTQVAPLTNGRRTTQ